MQTLQNLAQALDWLRQHGAQGLCSDTRRLRAGQAFLAWPGAARDARSLVAQALAQGAVAALVQAQGAAQWDWGDAPVAALDDLHRLAAPLADAFYGQPSRALRVLAVTGTNGKTSTAWWLREALSKLQQHTPVRCAFAGTLGLMFEADVDDCGLTTPDPVALHAALARWRAAGAQAVALEASSIGLAEHRLDALHIDSAVFTNLTQDHLDYHGDMAAYAQAKARLFDWPGLRLAALNVDDALGQTLAQRLTQRGGLDVWTLSTQHRQARLCAHSISHHAAGLRFALLEAGGASVPVHSPLVGDYNVSNLLGVAAALRGLGVALDEVARVCADLRPPPGRMQLAARPGQPLAVVDYAHTPDALEQALRALRPLAAARGGRLWVVFGCGGDRDPIKRALMGAVAGARADAVVLTSDNPRSEPPEAILSQILLGLEGVAGVAVEVDRARAIAQTLAQADAADVVLLAGKGHETYQEVAGVRRSFDDMAHVQAALNRREAQA